MPTVAELSALVSVKGADEARSALRGVQTELKGTAAEVRTANQMMVGAAAGFTAAGAALGVAFVSAARDAARLETAVATINTIKLDLNTAGMSAALNEMSTRIPQSVSSIGESVYDIFSSIDDISEASALKLAETFAKGATAARTDAQVWGETVTSVMTAYEMDVSQASAASDILFNTINRGIVTGPELAASLGPVTAAARMAGVSFEELNAMIVGVTKAPGPAAQNMNDLANTLNKITTKEAVAALGALGIATSDTAGKIRPVMDVMADLKQSMGGMSEAARALALQEIFPDMQARQGAAALMSQLEVVNVALAENRTQTDSTSKAYEIMGKTAANQSILLGNTVTAIKASLGSLATPVLLPLTTGLSDVLRGVLALDTPTKQTALAVTALAAGASTLTGAILALQAGAALTGPAMAAAGISIAAVAAPVAAVAAAVGLLAAAWINDWGGIQGKAADVQAQLTPFWAQMQSDAKTTADFLTTVVGPQIGKFFSDLGSASAGAASPITGGAAAWKEKGVDIGGILGSGVITGLKGVLGLNMVEAIWGAAKPAMQSATQEAFKVDIEQVRAGMLADRAALEVVAEETGEAIPEAIAAGVTRNLTTVEAAIEQLQATAVGGVDNIRKAIAETLSTSADTGAVTAAMGWGQALEYVDAAIKKLDPSVAALVITMRNSGDITGAHRVASEHLAAAENTRATAHNAATVAARDTAAATKAAAEEMKRAEAEARKNAITLQEISGNISTSRAETIFSIIARQVPVAIAAQMEFVKTHWGVAAAVEAAFRRAGDATGHFLGAISGTADHAQREGERIGRALGEGVADGIAASRGVMKTEMNAGLQELLQDGKTLIKARSPSEVTANEIGAPMMLGVAAGIAREAGAAAQAMESALAGVWLSPGVRDAREGVTRWEREWFAMQQRQAAGERMVASHPSPFGRGDPANQQYGGMYGGGYGGLYGKPPVRHEQTGVGGAYGTGGPTLGSSAPGQAGYSAWAAPYNPNSPEAMNAQRAQAQKDWANQHQDAVAAEQVRAALGGSIKGAYAEVIKELASGVKKAGKESEGATRSIGSLTRGVYGLERDAYPAADAVRAVSDVLDEMTGRTYSLSSSFQGFNDNIKQNASVYDAYTSVGMAANNKMMNAAAYSAPTSMGSGGAPSLSADPTQAGYYGAAYAQPYTAPTAEMSAIWTAQHIAHGLLEELDIPRFGNGGDVYRPTLAVVGEVPERITPHSQRGGGGGGTTIIVNYSPVMGADNEVERDRVARDMARRIERERRKLGLG